MAPLTTRRLGRELLDDPGGNPAVVATSLRNIARANRWFGGTAALCWGLARVVGDIPPGARITLLDIGSGLGDVPRAAVTWAARRGLRLAAVGLERNRAAASLAAAAGLPTILGCAGALPVSDKSVDIVSVCMVAHHFEPDSVVDLLRTCDRIARRAVIIADLRRAGLAHAAFRLGAWLLRFDPVTAADGLTSIERGFTPLELGRLLARAGVDGTVSRRPGWRLVATWAPV